MSASIHALPEAVLGAGILSLCGRQEGRSITLVCRQWRRLFYQQPSLWRSLEVRLSVTPPDAAAAGFPLQLALLRRVAPLLEEVRIAGSSLDLVGDPHKAAGASSCLAAFLEALQAATALSSLQLEQPLLSGEAAGALAALTCLRQLWRSDVGDWDAAALPALSRLQALTVQHWGSLHAFFDEIVPRMSPHLTSLSVHCTSTEVPMPPLQPLTRLSQLRELELVEDASHELLHGGLQLLPVTAFPAMQRLALCSSAHLKTSDGTVFPGLRLPGAPAVVQLRRRSLSEPPAWLLMCAHIVMSDGACLPALLEALAVQPGQLARLLLEGVGAEPELLPDAWPQLPGATRLILTRAYLPLDALLPRLPCLEVLNLASLVAPPDGQPLLAPLARCAPGLHTLQVGRCDVRELPQGPYLQSLRTLVLEDCCVQGTPPCLAAASRLEELSLQSNANLVIRPADVDCILARLPALRLLRLDEHHLAPGAGPRLQALAARQPLLRLEIRKEEGEGAMACSA